MKSGELFAGVGGLGMAVDAVFGSTPAWFAEFDEAPSKVLEHHYPDVPNYGDVTLVDFTAAPHTEIRSGGFPCTDVSLAGRRAGLSEGTRSGLWSEFRRSIAEDRPEWVVIENVRGLLTARGEAPHQAWADADADVARWERVIALIEHRITKRKGDRDYVARKKQERLRCTRQRERAVARRQREDRLIPRAIATVLRDLADLGFDAEWTLLRASDVGAPHKRERVFILAWPAENTSRSRSGGWPAG
ncbi:DNA cytosine methyltransferase [Microbacterium trichothecenolyticum]|uniref:Modification methylase HpaII n=1 Tax=Microbacterium trichothecenolyticum TaxID=69370 RepID=A0A0M2HFX9_MICTR|nr:DNA cytosine methyltransferase [Microbacterium trichothecenolyticum]KJL45587.1 Modification methylase HpaII [Microbacterium trichothecenolyticum]